MPRYGFAGACLVRLRERLPLTHHPLPKLSGWSCWSFWRRGNRRGWLSQGDRSDRGSVGRTEGEAAARADERATTEEAGGGTTSSASSSSSSSDLEACALARAGKKIG